MRLRNALLTGFSAIALTACGGDEQQAERRAVGPSIPRDVAQRLADRSDRVAAHLDSGDVCTARKEAAALRAHLTESVDQIPELYLEDLSGLVNEIEAQIPLCPQIPPPRKAGDDKEPDKGDKGDKHGRRDKEDKKEKKGKGREDEEDD